MLLALVHAIETLVAAVFKDRRPGRERFEVNRLADGDAKDSRKRWRSRRMWEAGSAQPVGIAQTACKFHGSVWEPMVWFVEFLTRTQTS